MQIDTNLILRLEKLSHLQLEDTERARFADDLGKIVDMVNQLQELDTTGVEPLVYLSDRGADLRPDQVTNQVSVSEALSNAPDADGQFFKVPKVRPEFNL